MTVTEGGAFRPAMQARSRRRPGALRLLVDGIGTWSAHLPGLALVAGAVWLPFYLLQGVLGILLGIPAASTTVQQAAADLGADRQPDPAALGGAAASIGVYGAVTAVLFVAAFAIAQALLVWAAAQTLGGRPAGVRQAWAQARGRTPAVLSATLLLTALILAVEAVLVVVGLLLTFLLAQVAHRTPGLTLLLTALVAVAAPPVIYARFGLYPQAAVLEGLAGWSALRRAFDLVTGSFVAVLGTLVVLSAAGWLAGALMGGLVAALAGHSAGARLLLGAAGSLVVAALFTPLPLVCFTRLYSEVRTGSD